VSGRLRVLLTNLTLASRTGTELWVRDAALGLLRRGHEPVVYTPDPGPLAEELRAATVPVVHDLGRIGAAPDLIHGHHQPAAVAALAWFPGVPALFVAHDWIAWHDAPPKLPRILRYVAVDRTNRDRLVLENGVLEERVRVLLNWVDLERFRPRGPLPERPRRALVFSNYARGETHLPAVAEACRRAGIPLDVVGAGAGKPADRPEELLGEYDLVFAKARCALEALAVGTAVVLCDHPGLGGMVTAARLDELRELNLGARTLQRPLSPDLLLAEIARYDAADAAEVSRRVRATAGLETALDALLALYREVIEEFERSGPPDPETERRAFAGHLQTWASWAPWLRDRCWTLEAEKADLLARSRALETEKADLLAESRAFETEKADLLAESRALEKEKAEAAAHLRDLEEELRILRGSAAFRLRDALIRLRRRG
jgi:hypothetical protein